MTSVISQDSHTPSLTDNLPFSAFRDADHLRLVGVTPGDLHDASRGIAGWIKSWPMLHQGRVEPHTNLFYVREYLRRRGGKVTPAWMKDFLARPDSAAIIEQWLA